MAKVFLSHSSKDKPLARKIATDLRTSGIDVWLDEWEIHVGQSITQKIEEGIESSQFVCVLLSKHSVESGWVDKEWRSVVGDEADEKRSIILPLKADDCPIPRLLRDKKYADFSGEYEFAMRSVVSAIRNLAVELVERRAIGHRIAFEPGDAYDLVTPALEWLSAQFQHHDWEIPLQSLRGTGLTLATLVRRHVRDPDDIIRFPWGVTLHFQPDIVGALRIPRSHMCGWVIGMVYPCTMFEYDVIRSHFVIAAAAAYRGFVFWDCANSFSPDGFSTLAAYGTPYIGIDDRAQDVHKQIRYVMHRRSHGDFIDDLEMSLHLCNRQRFGVL